MYLRLGDRGGGEHERRVGAVRRAHPAQPTQHLRDVGAEHAAVVVALVDDDVAQRTQELRPPVMGRQQRAVQHVGVGQHVLRVLARPVPLLARAVTVVGGEPDVEAERLQAGQLVLGEGLGRADVERGRAALLPQPAGAPRHRQRGQLVAERLARRRARRHHHVLAREGRLGGEHLVPPRGRDAPGRERRTDVVGHPVRPGSLHRGPGGQHLQVRQPLGPAGHCGESLDHVADGDGGPGLGAHTPILPSGSDIGRLWAAGAGSERVVT